MNNDNNVINLNEYMDNMDNIEELSEELLDEYMKQIDLETPDLWDRIEAGYAAEINACVNAYNNEQYINKANKKKANNNKAKAIGKYLGLAAAITLIAVIAIPVGLKKNDKSGDSVKGDSIMQYENTTEACLDEEILESAESDESAKNDSADVADLDIVNQDSAYDENTGISESDLETKEARFNISEDISTSVIMVNDMLYYYESGPYEVVDEGFESIGKILNQTNETPAYNFDAMYFQPGDEIFVNANDDKYIFVKTSDNKCYKLVKN